MKSSKSKKYKSPRPVKVVLKGFRCNVCGHITVPRTGKPPFRCGGCKSPYWNRPKKRKVA